MPEKSSCAAIWTVTGAWCQLASAGEIATTGGVVSTGFAPSAVRPSASPTLPATVMPDVVHDVIATPAGSAACAVVVGTVSATAAATRTVRKPDSRIPRETVPVGELDLIRTFQRIPGERGDRLELGSGDDAAVVRGDDRAVVSIDA